MFLGCLMVIFLCPYDDIYGSSSMGTCATLLPILIHISTFDFEPENHGNECSNGVVKWKTAVIYSFIRQWHQLHGSFQSIMEIYFEFD